MGESQRNSVPSGGRAVSGDRVRIVTVAFNPGAELAAMFASLHAAAYGLELHVVCVDNSPQPQPATARLCRDNGVTYISRPDNPGFGAATNLGMQAELAIPEPDLGTNPAAVLDREQKAPTEEWVMAVNPDIEFPPGAIAALVAGARRNPGGAIYGPALVGSDGQRYPTGRAFARFSNGIGHALLGRIWPGNPWTQAYWGRAWRGRATAAVDWLSGACLLLRRADWEALGGFDPRYFMYFEDADLGWRARRQLGRPAVLLAGVEVVHHQGGSTGGSGGLGRAARAHHESALLFLQRIYPGVGWRPVLWLMRVGLAARLAIMTKWRR